MHRTGIRSVTIIQAADGYAVDQVPIEQIEPGDTVLTHLPDGSAYTFVVDVKGFNIDKTAGTPPSVYRPPARSTTTEPAWSPPSKRRSAR